MESDIKYISIKYEKEKSQFVFEIFGYGKKPEKLNYLKWTHMLGSLYSMVYVQMHSLNPIKFNDKNIYCIYGQCMSKIDFYLYKIKYNL